MKEQLLVYEHRHSEINPIKIAIADDHKMIRELLAANINSTPGFKVVLSAENGRYLLQGIESLSQLPDICIIDINMPVMNGYDAQAAIKDKWPEIKSLAISIYDDSDCIMQMLRNGANGFISKQSSPETLNNALLEIFYENRYHKQIPTKLLYEIETLPELTSKEKEYIALVCNGQSNNEIANKMDISVNSVHYYRDILYRKLNVNSKAALIGYARRTGIVFMK